MANIEDIHEESDIFGVLVSNRYSGTLVAFKDSKRFNIKNLLKCYKKDSAQLILVKSPSAKIKKLLESGYRVLHCTEVGAHYYSADGK